MIHVNHMHYIISSGTGHVRVTEHKYNKTILATKHIIRLDTCYTIVVRSLIIKGSCNNSHHTCESQMLNIFKLLCLIVSKLGTVCAYKEFMIDINSLLFVGNGTPYISEIFSNRMKSSRQLL